MVVNGGHAGTKKGPNWGHVTFYPLKKGPLVPLLAENPSSEGATKDHLSSKPPQGEPPGTKIQSGR